jgi:molecular chaperone DnaK (HSP70)
LTLPVERASHVVGIDLGTTHTVVASSPLKDEGAARVGVPGVFLIPQLVATSEVQARPLLPSMLYAPEPGADAGVALTDDSPWVIGELARRRGVDVPGRLVASAKSWLCHPSVDRTAAILPWGAAEDSDVPRIAPVDASALVLAHVRAAWDATHAAAPLADQDVVLTVPASFDEDARELTVEAARRAGLSVRLLEEPQAAFYEALRRMHGELELLVDRAQGEALVLVVDVGGGTTDLSLFRATRAASGVNVERVAVGKHLLLGGDNMDLALAHALEPRLLGDAAKDGKRLDPGRFGQLVLACRAAKEALLAGAPPDDVPITLARRGSQLVGGTLSTRLSRDEVERIVLDGFFPLVARDAAPTRARSGLVAFGLPYERDVAITRHVAHFFARHAEGVAAPHAVLLNGGVFRAAGIVRRLTDAIDAWSGGHVEVLPHGDPDLGVALGAVTYGLALRGHGRRIESGAARGYYVGLDGTDGARRAVCVVPIGTKEGVRTVARGPRLALVLGRAVRFDLFACDVPRRDQPGDIITIDDDFDRLPPVATTFDAKAKGATIDVELEGEVTPVGTLELGCRELASSDREGAGARHFRLAFQLRGEGTAPPPATTNRAFASASIGEATAAIDRVFGKGRADVSAREVKDLFRDLERLLGPRETWTMPTLRALADALIPRAKGRRRGPDHERVYWQLTGYAMRPGFGDARDAERAATLAPTFDERVSSDEPRAWQAFWIAWRRFAGGLDEAAQTLMRDRIDPLLAPSEKRLKKPKGWRAEAENDLLDLVSSLERVPAGRRSELGGWLLERTWTRKDPRLWAAIGRLGARVPAYASAHHVVGATVAERWLEHLLREKWNEMPSAPLAAFQLARRTGDRARDVGERTRAEVERRLAAVGANEAWLHAVREIVAPEESDRAAFFGEALPVGLVLLSAEPGPPRS